jgi:hypothetical protein
LLDELKEQENFERNYFEHDPFYSIKEEDEDNEEDSFERQKRTRRERMQDRFEKKMDLIESIRKSGNKFKALEINRRS